MGWENMLNICMKLLLIIILLKNVDFFPIYWILTIPKRQMMGPS